MCTLSAGAGRHWQAAAVAQTLNRTHTTARGSVVPCVALVIYRHGFSRFTVFAAVTTLSP